MQIYHKYHAKPTIKDGKYFASKKEAQYAQELDLRVKAGEVRFYLRQIPFELPGNVKFRVDFMEFWADGTVHFVDVKGYDTPMGKLKRAQTEALYPIKVELA